MPNIRFFVEGDADRKFIKDLVKEHYNLELDWEIDLVGLGGWSEYKTDAKRFVESTLLGNKNIVIMDNDEPRRRAELEKGFEELGINAELFLMPYDDNRTGALENLLR